MTWYSVFPVKDIFGCTGTQKSQSKAAYLHSLSVNNGACEFQPLHEELDVKPE